MVAFGTRHHTRARGRRVRLQWPSVGFATFALATYLEEFCYGLRERNALELVAEVLWLHPLDLAVALDNDLQAVLLVAEHGFSHASLEGFVDHSPLVAEDSIDVFLWFSLHSSLWRWAIAQTTGSYTLGGSGSRPSATNTGSGPDAL